MIFATPELDGQEEAVIGKTEEIRRALSYAVQARRWTGVLRRAALARAIQGSNSIEGYHVSVEDAIAAAENEEPLDSGSETWLEIMGYRDAMTYVLQLSDDPHFSYSLSLIRALHYMMLRHNLSKHPGRWRPGTVYVRNDETQQTVYEGPPAESVDALVQELVSSLNEKMVGHVLVRAAMAHLTLVMVHPFSDGNGRMSRCLQTLVLAREGILAPAFCSIEEYLGANQREYYAVLAQVGAGSWQPARDARPWVRFCLTAHFRQATTLLRRSRIVQRLWERLESEVEKRKLPDRTVSALVDAAMGFRVRNATYRPMADVAIEVASRDLKMLADQGLLIAHGERRGRSYMGSELLHQMRTDADEPENMTDPFAA